MPTGVPDQAGNAAFAASMLLSTSSGVQHGASAISSPVLEFVTGMYLLVLDSRHSLLTQYLSLATLDTCFFIASVNSAVLDTFYSSMVPIKLRLMITIRI
jgi:hypothetical protein